MWVRTQDKMNLIEVQGFQIFYIKNKDEEYWEIYTIGISLGKYKSKEKALEVLDEIQKLLIAIPETKIPFNNIVYQMPEV